MHMLYLKFVGIFNELVITVTLSPLFMSTGIRGVLAQVSV